MTARESGYAPILTLAEFSARRDALEGVIVATSGGFDPIHPGHCTCILESRARVLEEHGVRPDHVVVIVNGDGFLRGKKGKPFQDLETRCRIVSCLREVDYVVSFEVEDDSTVIEALRGVRPHYFTKGGDRTDFTNIPEWGICEELGVKIVPRTGLEKRWSSSDFLADWERFSAERSGPGNA